MRARIRRSRRRMICRSSSVSTSFLSASWSIFARLVVTVFQRPQSALVSRAR